MDMQNHISHPKVLILTSYSLSSNQATDITLRSIFFNWPKSKVLIVTTSNTPSCFAESININKSFRKKTRRLALDILLKKKSADNKNLVPGAILTSGSNKTTFQSRVYSIGAAYADLFCPKISQDVTKRIHAFNPDFLYTPLGNCQLTRLSLKLSKELNIPIVPHFMDDWPSVRYTGSLFLKLPRFLLLHSLRVMFTRVNFGLCISDKMCTEYKARYKKDFHPLMNLISNDVEFEKIKIADKQNDKIDLAYFGGLHLNRWKSLKKIDETLTILRKILGKKIKLHIFTSTENKKKFSDYFSDLVLFENEINHNFVIEEMRKYDFLIHIESFDIDVFPFIQYSISTKIPEYFASQRPIIAIGPENAASIEYLKSNNCSHVVSTDKFDEIVQAFKNAFLNKENNMFVDNAMKTLIKNHSEKRIKFIIDQYLQG